MTPKITENVVFGRVGKWFYVNSATGLSRDRVETMFPNADADGSIPWEWIEKNLGPDVVVGGVTIRKEIEMRYQARTGKVITPERARQYARKLSVENYLGYVTYSRNVALEAHVESCVASSTEGIALRCKNLRRGKA